MRIEEACERLAKRTFDLDCSEIRFERKGKIPRSFRGPGNIWLDETGSLRFKVHLAQSDFLSAWQDILQNVLPRGEILPDEFLFEISITPYEGGIWTGKGWPGGLSNLLAGVGTATGGLSELKSESFGVETSAISEELVPIYLPYLLDFPKITATQTEVVKGGGSQSKSIAWDHSTIEIGNEKFTINLRENYTEIECVFGSGGISDDRPSKVLESLQFALAQILHPCALLRFEKGVSSASLLSSDPKVNEGRPQSPPLNSHTFWERARVYDIAKDYYQAISNRSKEARHDLARGVFAVIQSSGAPVEASVLGVSVAMETLIEATFPELKESSLEFIQEIEFLRPLLKTLKQEDGTEIKLSEEMLRRLNGCLNIMKAKGAANAIRGLVGKLKLEKRLYDSWDVLRNRYAHGGAIPSSRLGEVYNHQRNVIYLAWSIVLASINYTGPRTNYSLRGHPTVTLAGEVIKPPVPRSSEDHSNADNKP
jgi:hypothetical protein